MTPVRSRSRSSPAPANKRVAESGAESIVVITGASRGIGAALAKRLGAAGAQTVLLARSVAGLEATDDAIRAAGGPPALLVPLDFAKADQEFDQLGERLYERFGRVDGLYACAATLGQLGPVGHCSPKDWQQVMQVNLNANHRLIRSLDPLLRQSKAARAVFLTCRQGHAAEAYWAAYGASKAGLERLAQSYALETQKTAIKVTLFEPPPCATQLRAKAFPGEDQAGLATAEAVATEMPCA